MSGKPTQVIPREIPPLSTVVNDDGGLDIIAGSRVVATLALVNVEDFSGVTYYDLDIRPRSYVKSTESGEALRSWTRLARSGSDSVIHYQTPPKATES